MQQTTASAPADRIVHRQSAPPSGAPDLTYPGLHTAGDFYSGCRCLAGPERPGRHRRRPPHDRRQALPQLHRLRQAVECFPARRGPSTVRLPALREPEEEVTKKQSKEACPLDGGKCTSSGNCSRCSIAEKHGVPQDKKEAVADAGTPATAEVRPSKINHPQYEGNERKCQV